MNLIFGYKADSFVYKVDSFGHKAGSFDYKTASFWYEIRPLELEDVPNTPTKQP